MSEPNSTRKEWVTDWLGKGGYPIEMVTAREFRRRGFHVRQEHPYRDPTTEKYRQVDVHVWMGPPQFNSTDEDCTFALAIECKRTPGDAWIAFTSPGDEVPRPGVSHGVDTNLDDLDYHELLEWACTASNMVANTGRVAYSLKTTGKEDRAYGAVMQAVTAASCLYRGPDVGRHKLIVVPTLVIDAPLWECFLPENVSEPTVERITRAVVRVPHPQVSGPAFVQVIAIEDLEAFTKDAYITADTVRRALLRTVNG